jgi:hypothetical protein
LFFSIKMKVINGNDMKIDEKAIAKLDSTA